MNQIINLWKTTICWHERNFFQIIIAFFFQNHRSINQAKPTLTDFLQISFFLATWPFKIFTAHDENPTQFPQSKTKESLKENPWLSIFKFERLNFFAANKFSINVTILLFILIWKDNFTIFHLEIIYYWTLNKLRKTKKKDFNSSFSPYITLKTDQSLGTQKLLYIWIFWILFLSDKNLRTISLQISHRFLGEHSGLSLSCPSQVCL